MIKVIVVNSCLFPSCVSFPAAKLSLFIQFSWVIKESIRQSESLAHWLIYSKGLYGDSAP